MTISNLSASATAAAAAVTTTQAATSSSTGTATSGSAALQQLGTNFNQFLNLLMTQLQNQDPTQPMDTSQFTTELVQFTGVQQQVDTNSSLGQLISLQQGSQVLQSANIVGHQVTVSGQQIALQNSKGEVSWSGQSGQQVAIAIVDSTGNPILNTTVTSTGGTNTWTWNGLDNNGNQMPDGAYRIAAETGATADSTGAPLTLSTIGIATAVSNSGTNTQLSLEALSVPLSSLQAVDN